MFGAHVHTTAFTFMLFVTRTWIHTARLLGHRKSNDTRAESDHLDEGVHAGRKETQHHFTLSWLLLGNKMFGFRSYNLYAFCFNYFFFFFFYCQLLGGVAEMEESDSL